MTNKEAKDFLTHYICSCPYGTSPADCGDDKCQFGMAVRTLCVEERPQDDLSAYSDKLWKEAYERGKAEGRKTGYWFLLDDCANEGVYCSNCRKKVYRVEYANQKLKSNYCPNCGAKMTKESENECKNNT